MTIILVDAGSQATLESLLAYTSDDRPLASRRWELPGCRLEVEVEPARCCLFGVLDIPGFGQPHVFADNDGAGYGPADSPVDFPLESLRTRIRRVSDYLEGVKRSGAPVPPSVEERLERARAALGSIQGHPDASSLEGSIIYRALNEAMWAGEELVLAGARWRIQEQGSRSGFLLGGNLKGFHKGGQVYRDHFQRLFNYANIPLTWGVIEPERGRPHYEVYDEMVSWCQAHGIGIKGHALIWHSRWDRDSWIGDLDFEGMKELSVERTRDILKRYPGAFDAIELINEPVQANPFVLRVSQILEQVEAVYRVCRELAPQTRLMINFFNEWEEFYGRSSLFPPRPKQLVSMRQFLDLCRQRGIDFDLIGLQCHTYWDLFETVRMVRRWHRDYGLPIHITEIATPSAAGCDVPRMYRRGGARPALPRTRRWHEPWSEALQAEWLEQFVTVFYSLPEVEAAIIWGVGEANLWADYFEGHPNLAYDLAWMAHQGLLRADWTPKPGYEQLLDLARQWGIARDAAGVRKSPLL